MRRYKKYHKGKVLRGVRIRLLPTPKQETLFRKSAGIARWAYNYALTEHERYYQDTHKTLPADDLKKTITKLKKSTHPWLKEVSNYVIRQGILDFYTALDRFFKGVSEYPKFKRKGRFLGFYVYNVKLKRVSGGFKAESLGFVKTTKPLPKLSREEKYYINPRIKYDGKYWYLSFVIEKDIQKTNHTNEVIGIDLGIKELAVLSNGKVYHNINKTRFVRRLEKKLARQQRKLSRKIEAKIDHYIVSEVVGKDGKTYQSRKPVYKIPLRTCKNFAKQAKVIRLLYRKLTNIRTTYLHTVTAEIVKTKPSQIVIEDLDVSRMIKNKCLSKKIQDQKWYGFRWMMAYKCENYGIKLVIANRKYPSSKKCSCCGHKKTDLKLSDRIYKCSECGLTIDRDLNAAINLMNYQI